MRVLRLHLDDASMIEFHPFVSVATGMDDDQRALVRAAFVAAVSGDARLPGLIEVHDIVMDLDHASLQVLDLDGISANIVVTADDVPGAGSSDVARQLRAAERRIDLLEQSRRDAEDRVRAADAAVELATEALAAARAQGVEAHVAGRADDVDAAAGRAGADVDALRAAISEAEDVAAGLAGPAAAAAGALARARRELEEAESEAAAVAALLAEAEAEEADLRDQRAEVVHRLSDDAAAEVDAARAALRAAEAGVGAVPAADLEVAADAAEVDGEVEEAGEDDVDVFDPNALVLELGTAMESPAVLDAPDDVAVPDDMLPDDVLPDESEAVDDGARDALEAEAAHLRAALALQASFDPEPIRSALDSARAGTAVMTMVPSPEALGMADRLEMLDHRVEADADATRPPQSEVDAARQEVVEAEARYRTLENQLRGPRLSPEDQQALEALHARVLHFEEELESARLRKRRVRTDLETARAEEQALLERCGYRSYTDYLTGGPAAELTPDQADQLQRAGGAVLSAEAAVADIEERIARREALDEALADRAELRERARELLGDAGDSVPDEGLVDALVSHRVEADTADVVRPLRLALDEVGLRVTGLGMTDGEVLRMAADWLDEYQRGEDERVERAERLEEVEAMLAALDQDTPAATAPDDEEPVLADGLEQLDTDGSGGDAFDFLPFATDGDDGPDLDLVAALPGAAAQDAPPADAELAVLRDAVAAAERALEADAAARAELAAIDAELERVAQSRPLAADETRLARLRTQVAEAERHHDEIEARRAEAESELVRLRAVLRTLAPVDADADDGDADARLDEELITVRSERLAEAEAAAAAARVELDEIRHRHDSAFGEVASLQQAVADNSDTAIPVEELEFYLLARLAALRDVCFGGSIPLLIDGALDALGDRDLDHVLGRVERMAGAVQVVHLTDDQRIVDWARGIGERRAAVVAPVAPVPS